MPAAMPRQQPARGRREASSSCASTIMPRQLKRGASTIFRGAEHIAALLSNPILTSCASVSRPWTAPAAVGATTMAVPAAVTSMVTSPRGRREPLPARQRCDARRARVLESARSATTAAGGREGELGRAIGRARTTLGAENRSAIVATAQRQRFSRLADSRAQATWRFKATYDLPVFFRMDAQGGGCTPDSCVRGCTLTIVAY